MAEAIEPGRVAVVGMAVRVPGAERDLDRFWQHLEHGTESITFFERDELLAWGVPPELMAHPGFVPARAVLSDADCFDGRLFGYAPQESVLMDPQQRILLECAWSALEHAGYPPVAADGNRTGVYVGTGMNVYLLDNVLGNEHALRAAGGLQLVIASDKDFAATRIAYKLNLQGPALALQTACSTSLVAVHTAVQSLLTYDTDMALAGGATIAPPSRRGYVHEPGGIFSPDGHCRTFDASAHGTVPGDGAGVVVLKRLEDALRDNDTIHAVIAGSAVNNDGSRKAGFTAPGPTGQAAAITAALEVAGVDPDTIGVIEAHGTATALGDPIEVAALRQVFDTGTPGRTPCALTAVKSIIGHLDTAAGVVGLIKMVLALRHRTIPPVAHFRSANPGLELEGSPFHVPAAAKPWEPVDGVRRAGVSAFGIGGTNAHVVLEEAPPVSPAAGQRPAELIAAGQRPAELILVSARTSEAAAESLARVTHHVEGVPEDALADVAYTLRVGRTELPWRVAFVPGAGRGARSLRRVDERRCSRGVVFVFTGDGEPSDAAASHLADPAYRRLIAEGTARLLPVLGGDLWSEWHESSGRGELDDSCLARSARFLSAMALSEALHSRGVRPSAVLGCGTGAVAAACTAGTLSFAEGLALVAGSVSPREVHPKAPELATYSAATGARLLDEEARDADYWAAQLGRPAGGGIDTALAELHPAAWLTIGTDVTLQGLPVDGTASAGGHVALLTIVGALWEIGIGGTWAEEHDAERQRVPVPTYPFAPTRHYLDTVVATSITERRS